MTDLTRRPDRALPYSYAYPLAGGAAVGLLFRLIFHATGFGAFATMMLAFIAFAPLAIGAVTAWLAERKEHRSLLNHFMAGASAGVLTLVGSLITSLEGIICVILISPVAVLLSGMGGLLMGVVIRRTKRKNQVLCLTLIWPILLGSLEHRIPVPNDRQSVSRVVAVEAGPNAVWQQLVRTDHIRADEIDDAWMYAIGVPLPLSGITRFNGEQPVRDVRMGRGVKFEQYADIWKPSERVLWRYAFTEESFPPGALDDHVRIGGYYFDLFDTDYRIIPTPKGSELHATMTYRVSTHFNWYAEPIARLLIGDFLDNALALYKTRAESA